VVLKTQLLKGRHYLDRESAQAYQELSVGEGQGSFNFRIPVPSPGNQWRSFKEWEGFRVMKKRVGKLAVFSANCLSPAEFSSRVVLRGL
jgi:hypothetical protein